LRGKDQGKPIKKFLVLKSKETIKIQIQREDFKTAAAASEASTAVAKQGNFQQRHLDCPKLSKISKGFAKTANNVFKRLIVKTR